MSTPPEIWLNEMRIYDAFAQAIHKKRMRGVLAKPLAAVAGLFSLSAASAAAADFYLSNGSHFFAAVDIIKEGLIEASYNPDPSQYIASGVIALSAGSIALWGLDYSVSRKLMKKGKTAQSVFSVPHYSVDSEKSMYSKQTGKSPAGWEDVRNSYFKDIDTWVEVVETAIAIYTDSLRINKTVPNKVLKHQVYQRPSLEEILRGTSGKKIESRKELGKSAKASFKLHNQLNQAESYFMGEVFDSTPQGVQDFVGSEVVVSKLPDGKFLAGSIGPEPPGRFHSNYEIEKIVSNLILPYYKKPPVNSIRIGVVTEGTYPFIRGGVSTVVDDLMKGLSSENYFGKPVFFEAVSLWANSGPFFPKLSFEIAENIHINPPVTIYGYSDNPAFKKSSSPSSKKLKEMEIKKTISELERVISENDFESFFRVAGRIEEFSESELMHSPAAVETVYEMYHQDHDAGKPDFLSYFYQWQSIRMPLIRVIKSDKVPADLYYAVVTGAGGVYAVLAKKKFNAGMVLTEHGIYKEDRLVDLANTSVSRFYYDMWKKALDFYSALTYSEADFITTTCKCNSYKQLNDGADERKLRLIPGNITMDDLHPSFKTDPDVFSVGLLGNVQRVKKVEVFIEAASLLSKTNPGINFEFKVMGRDDPTDSVYVSQIHSLVEQKKLNNFIFSPYTDYHKAFAGLDCGVLTSASEVQPRAVMELLSMGKPMIAPDVGGIAEMVYGTDCAGNPSIDSYGKAGIVIDISSPSKMISGTADAILALYYRKRLILNPDRAEVPDNLKPLLSSIMSQEKTIEEVGPLRINNYFERKVAIPQYAAVFREALKK